jgi:hypothetical protein
MRLLSSLLTIALAIVAALSSAFAQDKMQTPAGEAPGPWLFGSIGVGKGADGKPLTTALNGLAIKLGVNGKAGIAYDLDLCRVAGAWTGGKFVTAMNLMSRGEIPMAMGDVLFTTDEVPGFVVQESGVRSQEPDKPWKNPRPLPKRDMQFKGISVQAGKTVLKWDIGGAEILESPGVLFVGGVPFLMRSFEVSPRSFDLRIHLPRVQFQENWVRVQTGADSFQFTREEELNLADSAIPDATAPQPFAGPYSPNVRPYLRTPFAGNVDIPSSRYARRFKVFITPGANSGGLYAMVLKNNSGVPLQMPIELHAKKAGVELRFTSSLDTQSAADPDNWNVEASTIAQAEKPPVQMTKAQRDPLKVKSVSIGTDDRSVLLEIEGMKPGIQMSIRYAIKYADGSDLKGVVVDTIYVLGE